MTHAEPTLWTDSSLGPGPLGIFVYREADWGSDRLRLIGAASNGQTHCVVPREKWGAFLRHHASATLVCYDAAETHWLLHELLDTGSNNEDVAVLWAFSRECRLIDVGLFDQELRRVQGDGFTPNRYSLARLAQRLANEVIPNREEFKRLVGTELPPKIADLKPERLHPLIQVAGVLLRIEQSLRTTATEILIHEAILKQRVPIGRSRSTAPSIRSRRRLKTVDASTIADGFPAQCDFGLLAIGLDVMSHIALYAASHRGMGVNAGAFPILKVACEEVLGRASGHLQGAAQIRGRLKWLGSAIQRTDNGEPQGGQDALKAAILQKRKDLYDRMWLPARLPKQITASMTTHVNQLGVWCRCDDDLAALAEIAKVNDVSVWLETHGRETARPVYEAIGLVHSRRPDLDFLRRLRIPVFTPRPGYRLLTVEPEDLGARCFAVLLLSWYGESMARLYRTFACESEPIAKLAADIRALLQEGPHNVLCHALDQLSKFHREDCWLLATKCLLAMLPLGLPITLQLRLLGDVRPLRDLDERTWDSLAQALAKVAGADRRNFLGEDFAIPLGQNLGVSPTIVRKTMEIGRNRDPDLHPRYDSGDFKIRREIEGKTVREVTHSLFTKSPFVFFAHPSTDGKQPGFELLKMRTSSPGGRLTSRWFPADVRRQAWEALIGDVVKRMLYALTASGYCLFAAASNELVIEVAEACSTEEVEAAVSQICREAGAELLGAAVPHCRLSWLASWPPSPEGQYGT